MTRATGRSSATSKDGKAWDGRFKQRQTGWWNLSPFRWRSIAGFMPMTFRAALPIARRWGGARVLTAAETKTIVRGLGIGEEGVGSGTLPFHQSG